MILIFKRPSLIKWDGQNIRYTPRSSLCQNKAGQQPKKTKCQKLSQRLSKADSAKTEHHNLHDEMELIAGLMH